MVKRTRAATKTAEKVAAEADAPPKKKAKSGKSQSAACTPAKAQETKRDIEGTEPTNSSKEATVPSKKKAKAGKNQSAAAQETKSEIEVDKPTKTSKLKKSGNNTKVAREADFWAEPQEPQEAKGEGETGKPTETAKIKNAKKLSAAKVPDSAKLSDGDIMLKCIDCERKFVFNSDEQRMFRDFGYSAQPPKRCHDCRREKKERNERIAAKEAGKGKGKGKDKGKDGKGKDKDGKGKGKDGKGKDGKGKDGKGKDGKGKDGKGKDGKGKDGKGKDGNGKDGKGKGGAGICFKFKEGNCSFGSSCRFSHSL